MKRIMGVDYGDARTGIAVSDLLCSLVGTTTVIHSRNIEKTIVQICTMVSQSDVGEIVVGLPKNMDGSIGYQAEYCLKFKEMLEEALALEVIMQDERLTSKMADSFMLQADISRKKRAKNVDKLAASIILQSYLDRKK